MDKSTRKLYTMTIEDLLKQAQIVASYMSKQYRVSPGDLIGHCHLYLPALLSRVKPSYDQRSQIAYVRRSLKGYMLHYLRDKSTTIRTPRGLPPVQMTGLYDNLLPHHTDTQDLPEWVHQCLEHRTLGKRFANAYLRYLDT